MASIVYFIQQGHDNLFKIGRTDSSVDERLKSLQTGNPVKLRIFGIVECNGINEISEARLHQEFDQYRAEGEWFCINPARVIETLSSYKGKVIVDDPLGVSFVKGSQKKVVIEKNGADALELKIARARALRKKQLLYSAIAVICSIPLSLIADIVLSGLVFMVYSQANGDNSGFKYTHIFWSCLRHSFPFVYLLISCLWISSIFNTDTVTEDETMLEYGKMRKKKNGLT